MNIEEPLSSLATAFYQQENVRRLEETKDFYPTFSKAVSNLIQTGKFKTDYSLASDKFDFYLHLPPNEENMESFFRVHMKFEEGHFVFDRLDLLDGVPPAVQSAHLNHMRKMFEYSPPRPS